MYHVCQRWHCICYYTKYYYEVNDLRPIFCELFKGGAAFWLSYVEIGLHIHSSIPQLRLVHSSFSSGKYCLFTLNYICDS